MLKNLCLTTSLFALTSCLGVDEPKFSWCVMSSLENMHCFDPENKESVKPVKEALGYIMLSPDDISKLKDHHREIHIELDYCD